MGEFYVLDDEAKPISLRFKLGPIFQVQVVSITYPRAHRKIRSRNNF